MIEQITNQGDIVDVEYVQGYTLDEQSEFTDVRKGYSVTAEYLFSDYILLQSDPLEPCDDPFYEELLNCSTLVPEIPDLPKIETSPISTPDHTVIVNDPKNELVPSPESTEAFEVPTTQTPQSETDLTSRNEAGTPIIIEAISCICMSIGFPSFMLLYPLLQDWISTNMTKLETERLREIAQKPHQQNEALED